ncbi:four-carbon acid sugar kinase family protein [Chryseomicrobium palamuruense]|uniref:Four-carbon acid sugar kinase family protein n=1 Tax=Chryseomicrobium palamuruense TaxID=682973 RepID=A0ABV8USI5_9BACL
MTLLLGFYGDDFTGSTDAMEALYLKGYKSVLFLEAPPTHILESMPTLQCIGVAGTSRAKDPDGMEQELRPVLTRLQELTPKIVHYKVCSTFDSSPDVGSIGKAIEVANTIYTEQSHVPVMAGAPALGRYTLFGNHFAKSGDEVYRLDRHPIMSKHPSTPMQEADLGKHLAHQLSADIRYFTLVDNQPSEALVDCYKKATAGDVVIHDCVDAEMLRRSARIIWETQDAPLFVVGSSGVEYGLADYWESETDISPEKKTVYPLYAQDNVLVISGSASMITKNQIDFAVSRGYTAVRIPNEILQGKDPHDFLEYIQNLAEADKRLILFTALGPDDENIRHVKAYYAENGATPAEAAEVIGTILGKLTKTIYSTNGYARLVIAGGDTSGFITKTLGIDSLEVIQSISPGAPLCIGKSFSHGETIEVALKGGQFGSEAYFLDVQNAASERE